MPTSAHSKLPGLCKTRWVERHTCYEVFLEMYVYFVTFLDAIVAPSDYQNLLKRMRHGIGTRKQKQKLKD